MSFLEKVSQINNDPSIYGTIAEIGAGQEVAHAFFQVGHASSTIAKSMSAYDMKFSDAIYGADESYVCRQRLVKMLSKEYDLIRSRLTDRAEHTRFFVFADTVATGSQRRKIPGHGWLGVSFQHKPQAPISQVMAHIRFVPRSPLQQHRIVGEMGVNILYACFHHYHCVDEFLSSLTVDLDLESLEMDYIEFRGEAFGPIEDRLVGIELLKRKLTSAIIFDESGRLQPPSVHLYEKHLVATQGQFRPLTKSKWLMMESGRQTHSDKHGLNSSEVVQVAGIPLAALVTKQRFCEEEFHLRIDGLAVMNVCVLVSDFSSDFAFIQRLSKYTQLSKALVVGAHSLTKVVDESHYQHLTGGLLEALGMMVSHNTTVYIYPVKFAGRDLLTIANVFLSRNKRMLLDYMRSMGLCCEIDADETSSQCISEYYSSDMVRDRMSADQDRWQDLVPEDLVGFLEQHGQIWLSSCEHMDIHESL